ncbi:hypothetical protein, partial [Bradyrhizobium diazoefficiens]
TVSNLNKKIYTKIEAWRNRRIEGEHPPASPCVAPMEPIPVGETLSEDVASAQDGIAAKAASDHQELHDPPGQRQIGPVRSAPGPVNRRE